MPFCYFNKRYFFYIFSVKKTYLKKKKHFFYIKRIYNYKYKVKRISVFL